MAAVKPRSDAAALNRAFERLASEQQDERRRQE
jgi:hypothetical protein